MKKLMELFAKNEHVGKAPKFFIHAARLWVWLAAVIWLPSAFGQTIEMTSGVQTYTALTNITVNMTNACELRVTSTNSPLTGCTINLNSVDSFLVLPGIKPSAVVSTCLDQVRISGAAAVADGNCRVVQYAMGAIVVPHAPSFEPLTVYSEPNFTGSAMALGQYTYYKSSLGSMYANISSFKLKRGYVVTFAQNENGSGISKCYVAQDGDMEVSILPADLDNSVRFVYVMPWRWMSKKGIAGDPGISQLNVNWWYDWNIDQNSSPDLEYVPIRQLRWWPDLASQNWQTRGANTVLGYNEPDSTSQANITVGDAIWSWPDLLATGLRVGSPAPTDGGYSSWLYPFIAQADAANLRVDFTAVHYYRCFNPADPNGAANAMYNALKDIYDNTKRPIWITEWNNGANWTSCADPTYAQQQACVAAMINMLDNTPFVERYALYNWVEDVRALTTNGVLTAAGVTYRDKQSPVGYVQALQDNGTRSFAQLSFENNTLDSSGYGNNGITAGCPAYTNGHSGQALVFDGSNTAVTLPPNVSTNTAFTFAAWVNWGGGGNWQRLFDFGNSTTHYLFLTPSSGSGTLRFAIKNGGSEQIVETAGLPANQWRHVAITLSGNTAKLYTNGVLAAQNTGMTISPASFAPRMNFLGKSQFIADPMLNGLMDDVLITDYALTAAQIAALLTNQPPQFTNAMLATTSATKGQLYSDTLAGSATDPNAGDTLAYSKVSGPAWLTVAANGALGGTPTVADGGTNTFVVRVSDPAGASAFATLAIFVGPANLVAHYEFEGNTLSSVGTAHGVLTGAATYGVGYLGQAIDLDGATNYITLPVGISKCDEITVAAWVNPDVISTWSRIFDFGTGTSSYMFLTPSSGSGTIRYAINGGGGEQQINGTSALAAGVWSHVAVTFSGTTGVLYVNGVPVGTNSNMTLKPSSLGNTTQNYIGKSQFADPLFNGRVDEFYLYDRALTATEIATLASGGGALPATPTGLTATPGDNQVGLSWNASSGATSYNVKRATTSGGPYSTIASPTATSYTDTTAANGTTYYYVVSAVNPSGESADSSQVSATPMAIPATPTGLAATPGNNQVGLSWNASSGATSYNVKRATTSGGPYSTIGSPTATGYTDTTAVNGTTYYYVVSAVNPSGESGNSSEVSATPVLPVPATPSGLAATPGNNQVGLSWSVSSGATSYNVKRAATSGGPYSTIGSPTATSYTDTTAVNGTTYYYVVSAVNSSGESANSSEVSATPVASLPSPWVTADIGAVGATGSASYSSGTFTVTGSGADIGGTADEFRYVYQTSSGNCEMRARVATQQNTDPSAKAGVMIRESTAAGARYAAVLITPANGVVFQWRASTGGATSSTTVTGITVPQYVRIVRGGGGSFTAYYSANGTSWTQIGSKQTVSMSSSATMGLAVTSHLDGTLCTSTLDTITATP